MVALTEEGLQAGSLKDQLKATSEYMRSLLNQPTRNTNDPQDAGQYGWVS